MCATEGGQWAQHVVYNRYLTHCASVTNAADIAPRRCMVSPRGSLLQSCSSVTDLDIRPWRYFRPDVRHRLSVISTCPTAAPAPTAMRGRLSARVATAQAVCGACSVAASTCSLSERTGDIQRSPWDRWRCELCF